MIQTKPPSKKKTARYFIWPVVSCIIGICLNFSGSGIAMLLDIPLYCDAYGTVFTAATGGFLPGVTVGFCTNLLASIHNISHMSYGLLNMIIAAMTYWFIRRGWWEKPLSMVVTLPPYVILSIGYELLYAVLGGTYSTEFFMETVRMEIPDKILAVSVIYGVYMLLPKKLRQFPVNKRMKQREDGISRVLSLEMKAALILGTVCVALTIAVTSVASLQFRQVNRNTYIRIGEGITKQAAKLLNANYVDTYLEKGNLVMYESSYLKSLDDCKMLWESYPEVEYLYFYRMLPEGMQVVLDIPTDKTPADQIGEVLEWDESFYSQIDQFLTGKPVEPVESIDSYGHLLTVFAPVYDSSGRCVCYAAADFSMDILTRESRGFAVKMFTMFMGMAFFIFACGIRLVHSKIIRPVNTIARCAGSFSYGGGQASMQNVEKLRALDIHTGDEIENLYQALLKTTEDSMQYMQELRAAEQQVSQISETAYQDALTGVKSIAAYKHMKENLARQIKQGIAEFAIVMVDLNHLKRINDTYGHKCGDQYIMGACGIICDIYKHAPVFRVGGDEFVVVLMGESYEERDALLDEAIEKFRETACKDAEPWQKYSAALGMAVYINEDNETVDEVFSRADENMYVQKMMMKANRIG